MEKVPDRWTAHSTCISNRLVAQSLSAQSFHSLIAFIALLSIECPSSFIRSVRCAQLRDAVPLRSLFPSARLSHCMLLLGTVLLLQVRRRRHKYGLRFLFFPGQTGSLPIKQFFELLSHIFDAMKTVRPLPCLGSPLPCCIGVTAGTVSAHDLTLRVLLTPQFDAFRSPIREQVDDPMVLSIAALWSHTSGHGANTTHPHQRRAPSHLQGWEAHAVTSALSHRRYRCQAWGRDAPHLCHTLLARSLVQRCVTGW